MGINITLISVYCKTLSILCLHVHVVLSIKTLDFRRKDKMVKLFCQGGRFLYLVACYFQIFARLMHKWRSAGICSVKLASSPMLTFPSAAETGPALPFLLLYFVGDWKLLW